jgi:glucan biosynthesis protein C
LVNPERTNKGLYSGSHLDSTSIKVENTEPRGGKTVSERRYDIDWVRVVATLAVFVLHCGRFFDTIDWHLKNAQQSAMLTLFQAWLDQWMMPLLFLLSGLGSWYSLRSRSPGHYLLERVKRLLIPLYTVGAFILLPPQFYFELLTHRGYRGTVWELIPPLYDGPLRFFLDEPYLINLWPGHLWFLQFLFILSLVMLPLLLLLRSASCQRLIDGLAAGSARWGGIFLFLVPLAIVRIALRGFFRGEHTWADLAYYAVFFLIGALIAADRRFTEGYKRHGWLCLALGLVAYGAELALIFAFRYPYPGRESFSGMYVLFNIVMGVGNFCWVMFILSLGAKYLNFNNRVLGYAGEAVLPFYIFHQTIILCVGWFVIRWRIGILPKYLIVALVSFPLIMALYELLVRRWNVVRFLFGMRPERKLPSAPAQRPEGAAA